MSHFLVAKPACPSDHFVRSPREPWWTVSSMQNRLRTENLRSCSCSCLFSVCKSPVATSCRWDGQMCNVVIWIEPPPHNHFTALFLGPPGWAGARRELLDFLVQGKINSDRHTDHPAGRHSIRTNQCPPPPSLHFFTGRIPFLPPNQQCQSTEGNFVIWNFRRILCTKNY